MNDSHAKAPRYRFAEFVVSPSRRLLLRGGEPVSLIPRYFDLLLLLLERRNEAVHRRDILDAVWSDVVVSDGALTQAVRVLRRALGDDPRQPVYIHTVARHGYRFIFEQVFEEPDQAARPAGGQDSSEADSALRAAEETFEGALGRLLATELDESERREAAETLHALGTAEALRRLGRRRRHAGARAFLRDTRWDVPGAGPVPIVGQPGALVAASRLVGMRLRRALRLAGSRWASAVVGGAAAGLGWGLILGLVLRFGPGSVPAESVLVGLPVVGMLVGALGACGVGGGLAGAEVLLRSWRGPGMVAFGAAGGWAVGSGIHWLGLVALQSLFGGNLRALGGGFEGLVLGGAVSLGYALATPLTEGGMAAPRGRSRLLAALLSGLLCAAAAVALAASGSFLLAVSLEFMALSFPGSYVSLTPLARLLGEERLGWLTNVAIGGFEGLLFGFGVVLGLTRRPPERESRKVSR